MKTRKNLPNVNLRKTSLRRAFSLLEILIVLAILVVLIGLIAPRLLRSQSKANESATKLQMASVKGAVNTFRVDLQRYPTTEEGLEILVKKPTDETEADRWDGPYFEEGELPKDAWGRPFKYEYDGKINFPKITSLGQDGEENTEDDITNFKSQDEKDENGNDDGGDDDFGLDQE